MSVHDHPDLAAFKAQQVTHPLQQRALEEVLYSLDDEDMLTALVGPSGVGKSNLLELIEMEARDRFATSANQTGRVPFLKITAKPPARQTYQFADFYRSILEAADEVSDRKRAPAAAPRTESAIQTAALNVLRFRAPEVFCVDEVQHITLTARTERRRVHLDHLKTLAITVKVPILLAGTPEILEGALDSSALGRRMNQVILLPYALPQLAQFMGAVSYFADVFPLKLGFTPAAHAEFFFQNSAGSVGFLKVWMERALRRALASNVRSVSIEDFKRCATPVGKLRAAVDEYTQTLKAMRAIEGNTSDLRILLGLDVPKAPSVPAPRPRRRVGQRALTRDAVGVENGTAA